MHGENMKHYFKLP